MNVNNVSMDINQAEKHPIRVIKGNTAAVDNQDLISAANTVAKLTGKDPKRLHF